MTTPDYRAVSFWFDSLATRGDEDLSPRPALTGQTDADVCIVGAGLTGLWSAYYLARSHPELSIVVLEQEIAGFGASGRNGGWCSALFPVSTTALARLHGVDAAIRMRAAMIETIDEIGRVVAAEKLDCDFLKGGTLAYVRNAPALAAAREELAEARRYGLERISLMGTDALRQRAPGVSAVAATLTPDCARIHPAALARGLARVVERMGVRIYERTRASSIGPGRVETLSLEPPTASASAPVATVRAGAIINATEAYGSTLPGGRRAVLPLYSLMIATEPLPEAFWQDVGIEHGQTFTDYRHLLIYGQRTADNRFAFGGRGARYHWGSAIRGRYDTARAVAGHLQHALVELFPGAADARITHHWGGPLGVPRDWHASVGFSPDTRIGWAGGYVGDGVSTTNLAGRTLARLITGDDGAEVALPWVNHRSPRWEREPWRFLGANAGLAGMAAADLEERMTRRPSRTARLMAPLIGH